MTMKPQALGSWLSRCWARARDLVVAMDYTPTDYIADTIYTMQREISALETRLKNAETTRQADKGDERNEFSLVTPNL